MTPDDDLAAGDNATLNGIQPEDTEVLNPGQRHIKRCDLNDSN